MSHTFENKSADLTSYILWLKQLHVITVQAKKTKQNKQSYLFLATVYFF